MKTKRTTSHHLTRASMVVMSHLSDVQIAGDVNTHHIEFVKYIILQCNGNLNKNIDPDKMWTKYIDSIDLPF